MTKQEFLDRLRAALSGRVSTRAVAENISFYEDYINTQVRMGKSEAQVIEELGDPRLLARSIAEAEKRAGLGSSQEAEYRTADSGYGGGQWGNAQQGSYGGGQWGNERQGGYGGGQWGNERQGGYGSGRQGNAQQGNGTGSRSSHGGRVPIWLVICIVLLVVVLVLSLVFSVLSFLAPILIPVMLIVFAMRLLSRRL